MTKKDKESVTPEEIPPEVDTAPSEVTEIEPDTKIPPELLEEIDPLEALTEEHDIEVNLNCVCGKPLKPDDDGLIIRKGNRMKGYHLNCAIHKADRVRLVNLI